MNLKYYIFHKPFGYLSQFSNDGDNLGIKTIIPNIGIDVYPLGRLDLDSEGLLILSNDKKLNQLLLDPKFNHNRVYYSQVEGLVDKDSIDKLQKGVEISTNSNKYTTKPAKAEISNEQDWLEERNPPIRKRKDKVTSWIKLTLTEGKNRQVRKMTASVGLPTLRLIRFSIENINIVNLKQGETKEIDEKEIYHLLNINSKQKNRKL